MIRLSRPNRAARSDDWSPPKAVTFIVTLAAGRSVTLAARAAGMSRKAAYALRDRDPLFAEAWRQALSVQPARQVDEVHDPLVSPPQGDTHDLAPSRATPSADRGWGAWFRDKRPFDLAAACGHTRGFDADLLLRTKALSH